jgi:hypothetical protein
MDSDPQSRRPSLALQTALKPQRSVTILMIGGISKRLQEKELRGYSIKMFLISFPSGLECVLLVCIFGQEVHL